jgi:hypothetical protein
MRLSLISEVENWGGRTPPINFNIDKSNPRYKELILELDRLAQSYKMLRHIDFSEDQILKYWDDQFESIIARQGDWVTKKKIIGQIIKKLPDDAYSVLDFGSWGSSPIVRSPKIEPNQFMSRGKITHTWRSAEGPAAAKARFGLDD